MRKILVTSALPYANGPIHIGHLAGCYLPADIYVRYHRLKGDDIIHICGTDDHGTPITLVAKKENKTPKQISDEYHDIIKNSLKNFGIEYTNFSRTCNPIHYEFAQKFFFTLYKSGYLICKKTKQFYCERCKMFLPDRYVEGTCPYCDDESARGDLCEKCGRWLEPFMLKKPRCGICGITPIIKESKHWYFRLDLVQDKLEDWINTIEWKPNVIGEVNKWLKEKLSPRPITRDIEWGVPVPLKEAKGKVLYVWFEALLGYISATIEWDNVRWKDYWQDTKTHLVHFIGKDNIVFHAIVFPCMLLAHGNYVLPYRIPANEFLTIENRKISTSRNWAVWLPEYLEEFPADILRYALTVNAPERGDSDFSFDDFLSRNNNELLGILGNFVNRTLAFVKKYKENKITKPTYTENELLNKLLETKNIIGNLIDNFEFKKAIKEVMSLVSEGNRYFDYNKPWEFNEKTDTVIYNCCNFIANLSIILEPFLPFTSQSICKMLKIKEKMEWDKEISLEPNKELGEIFLLFNKIEKERIELQKTKLGKVEKRISIDEFNKLDIVIGEIISAEKIAGSDKLLKLKVLLGKDKSARQIVAGIGKSYTTEELIGKKIAVLANLTPKYIFGEYSDGMVLATSFGDKVILLVPEKPVNYGSKVK